MTIKGFYCKKNQIKSLGFYVDEKINYSRKTIF
jgi:hypothetical protein